MHSQASSRMSWMLKTWLQAPLANAESKEEALALATPSLKPPLLGVMQDQVYKSASKAMVLQAVNLRNAEVLVEATAAVTLAMPLMK